MAMNRAVQSLFEMLECQMKSDDKERRKLARHNCRQLRELRRGYKQSQRTMKAFIRDVKKEMQLEQPKQLPHPVVEWKDWVYPHLEGLDDEGALVHDEGRYIVTDMGTSWDLLDAKIKYRNGAGVFSFTDADGKFRYIPKNAQIFQQASTQQTPLRIYNQHTNDACSSSNVFFSVLRTRR